MADTPSSFDHGGADRALLRRLGQKVRKRLAANPAVQQIPAQAAEIWAVGQFFDPAECARLIAMVDRVAQPSEAYGQSYASGHRTSYSGDVDPTDPFIRGLEARIDALIGLDHRSGETIQGQRYTVGQQFKPHIDWFPPRSAAWQDEKQYGGQRAFTVMAYLNTVEDGGETDFPELDIAIHPRAGTLVVWNNIDPDGVPNPRMIHAGNPVLRGTKYVITKWYRMRPWQ